MLCSTIIRISKYSHSMHGHIQTDVVWCCVTSYHTRTHKQNKIAHAHISYTTRISVSFYIYAKLWKYFQLFSIAPKLTLKYETSAFEIFRQKWGSERARVRENRQSKKKKKYNWCDVFIFRLHFCQSPWGVAISLKSIQTVHMSMDAIFLGKKRRKVYIMPTHLPFHFYLL